MGLSAVRLGAAIAALLLTTGAPAQAQTGGSQRWLLGPWSDNGTSCAVMVEFRRDGTFFIESEDKVGRWQLQGDQLTFSGSARSPRGSSGSAAIISAFITPTAAPAIPIGAPPIPPPPTVRSIVPDADQPSQSRNASSTSS